MTSAHTSYCCLRLFVLLLNARIYSVASASAASMVAYHRFFPVQFAMLFINNWFTLQVAHSDTWTICGPQKLCKLKQTKLNYTPFSSGEYVGKTLEDSRQSIQPLNMQQALHSWQCVLRNCFGKLR